MRLIQNFWLGDNFPPQNESVAGLYHVYHYFWAMIPALFEALGLSLVSAINLYSALFFSLVMLTAVGIMEEYFFSKIAYILLPIFIVSHGSLKLFDYLYTRAILIGWNRQFFEVPVLIGTVHGGRFGFNDDMFNVSYFIQERQLIFACLALLIYVYVLLRCKEFSLGFIVASAVFFGLFVQWHIYITIFFIVIGLSYTAIRCVLNGYKKTKKILLFSFVTTLVSFIFIIGLKVYTYISPEFDYAFLRQFPKINFSFTAYLTQDSTNFLQAFLYYLYGYGFRIIIYIGALIIARKYHKNIFYIWLSAIPIFVLVNTLQFSPLTVHDNHKWLRPFNLLVDVFSLSILSHRLSKSWLIRSGFLVLILLASISGIVSFLNFAVQTPAKYYADFSSSLFRKISRTDSKSVFLTNDSTYVFLAGRKTYVTKYLGQKLGIQTDKRQMVQDSLQKLKDTAEMCKFLLSKNLYKTIDYISFTDKSIYIDVKKECFKTK
ncbi:hypothetical protein HY612_05025 [Candidatus Roizmanbacteria bacterium]|nr:hypothetical protein [Candidatus Roizmanbacteria bacterium]